MRSPSTDELFSNVADDPQPGDVPLLVSGRLDAWWCWAGVGMAVIFGTVAVVASFQRHPLRFGFVAVSVLAAITAVVCFGLQFWRRRWLTWSTDSLRVTGRGTSIEILDSDVEFLAATRDYRHAVGRIVAEEHRVWIWTSSRDPRVVALETRSSLGEPSPLSPLVDRIQQRLERRAMEELRREGAILSLIHI